MNEPIEWLTCDVRVSSTPPVPTSSTRSRSFLLPLPRSASKTRVSLSPNAPLSQHLAHARKAPTAPLRMSPSARLGEEYDLVVTGWQCISRAPKESGVLGRELEVAWGCGPAA